MQPFELPELRLKVKDWKSKNEELYYQIIHVFKSRTDNFKLLMHVYSYGMQLIQNNDIQIKQTESVFGKIYHKSEEWGADKLTGMMMQVLYCQTDLFFKCLRSKDSVTYSILHWLFVESKDFHLCIIGAIYNFSNKMNYLEALRQVECRIIRNSLILCLCDSDFWYGEFNNQLLVVTKTELENLLPKKEADRFESIEAEPEREKEAEPEREKEAEPEREKEAEPEREKEAEPEQEKEAEPEQEKEAEPEREKEAEPEREKEAEPEREKEAEPEREKEQEQEQKQEKTQELKQEQEQVPAVTHTQKRAGREKIRYKDLKDFFSKNTMVGNNHIDKMVKCFNDALQMCSKSYEVAGLTVAIESLKWIPILVDEKKITAYFTLICQYTDCLGCDRTFRKHYSLCRDSLKTEPWMQKFRNQYVDSVLKFKEILDSCNIEIDNSCVNDK